MNESDILQRYVDEVQPVTNWPEWKGNAEGPHCPERTRPMRLVLFTDDVMPSVLWWAVESNDGQGWAFLRAVCDHEALCLWQNHTITWFQERFTYVSIEWDGTAKQWLVMAGFYVPKGDDTGNVQFKADSHDKNIHLALIAAVKATQE